MKSPLIELMLVVNVILKAMSELLDLIFATVTLIFKNFSTTVAISFAVLILCDPKYPLILLRVYIASPL